MADIQDAERNYPATPRRIEQARERGQVARSRELTTAAVALAAAIGAGALGPVLAQRCMALFKHGLAVDREGAFVPDRMLLALTALSEDALIAVAPLLGLLLAASLVAPLLLSGWVFSLKAVFPDFGRLDPIGGIARLFSSHGLVELAKALAMCTLVGIVGAWTLWHHWGEMRTLAARNALDGALIVADLGTGALFALAGALVVIALADAPYQLWRYYRELRMTREEVRQELREMEGDPQLKARIRSLQRAAARRRMMAAVPKASVIVTNPTRFAVALEYREGAMRAPRVVAKGAELIAARIREVGIAHGVPVLEAPPLARALYRHADLGAEIPSSLYAVVAQVLAYVHQVRRARESGGAPPLAPTDLDVPPGLDPQSRNGGAQ